MINQTMNKLKPSKTLRELHERVSCLGYTIQSVDLEVCLTKQFEDELNTWIEVSGANRKNLTSKNVAIVYIWQTLKKDMQLRCTEIRHIDTNHDDLCAMLYKLEKRFTI